ncbi:hypothetical protein EVAR_89764_1 [Eumeta japonica]|uniref:Uncharacterized protein n=1 Tax=Eumeta variegata TaxID=151549 RepID=A0A4C1XCE7_EUMVA|nr:hypothetical protein EVAR_89764_1 [Eumeta japonica]
MVMSIDEWLRSYDVVIYQGPAGVERAGTAMPSDCVKQTKQASTAIYQSVKRETVSSHSNTKGMSAAVYRDPGGSTINYIAKDRSSISQHTCACHRRGASGVWALT